MYKCKHGSIRMVDSYYVSLFRSQMPNFSVIGDQTDYSPMSMLLAVRTRPTSAPLKNRFASFCQVISCRINMYNTVK